MDQDLGEPFTGRDAAAAPFDHLLSRETPRDPASWPDVQPLPVAQYHIDKVQMEKALGPLGKAMGGGMLEHAKQAGLPVPAELTDPTSPPSAAQIITFSRSVALQFFPRLTADDGNGLPSYAQGGTAVHEAAKH
jgi:hypothetical protein